MAEISLKYGSIRWWLAILLLIVLTVIFVGMGRWQLQRAQERREIAHQIEAGRTSAALRIDGSMTTSSVAAWQAASATGQWLPQYAVLLDNRADEGKPGLWLAMPLRLDDGSALLVMRGWLPRPLGDGRVALSLGDVSETLSVQGEIALHVPRMYELQADGRVEFGSLAASGSAAAQQIDVKAWPRRQNLSIDEMSDATGLRLLPFVLMQTHADHSILVNGRELVQNWPEPSLDADKNMGYAIQWFSFAAIAAGALVVLLWRTRRRATISP